MSVLNDTQFTYSTVDTGAGRYKHLITAQHPEHGDIGRMQWDNRSIDINVDDEHTRQGVATSMWEEGHRMAGQDRSIPQPKHSSDRTDKGDAWARSVGGRLPRRSQG